MLLGYARVSTDEQTTRLQLDALAAAGCERTFSERASGAASDRPVLGEVLSHARDGDTVIVWKLDRLGRSLPPPHRGRASPRSQRSRPKKPNRRNRHPHAKRAPDLTFIRSAGGVRARSYPGADSRGAGGGTSAGEKGWQTSQAQSREDGDRTPPLAGSRDNDLEGRPDVGRTSIYASQGASCRRGRGPCAQARPDNPDRRE